MRYPNTGNLTIEENDNYKMTFYKKKNITLNTTFRVVWVVFFSVTQILGQSKPVVGLFIAGFSVVFWREQF